MAYLDQKISKFASYIQSGASILYRNICNDYLWPLMVETDMPVYVLTCFRVYSDLQDKKLVKNMPKIQILSPWNRNHQSGSWILCWDIFNDHLCSYMIDTDMRECILSCVRVHVISRVQNVVKNMRIMSILAPWILIFQSRASLLFKTYSMTIYGH